MAQSTPADGLDLRLDRSSEVPLGTQLAWKLRAAIVSGALAPGGRAPGIRELAAAAGVNVNTVRSVYARLVGQGLLVSEHGRGTFVSARLPAQEDLGRLAASAAAGARDAGIDPRELAAAVYASSDVDVSVSSPPEAGPGGAAVSRTGNEFTEEARRRSALRAEIARLDRRLTPLEPLEEKAADLPARRGPAPQLLSAAELEAIRDDLARQLDERRAERVSARHELDDERRRAPRRPQHGIADDVPQVVTEGGAWRLRWNAN